MQTIATLHVHPAAADPMRIFEIRRLARDCGCPFIASKPKSVKHHQPMPFDPNDGGRAA